VIARFLLLTAFALFAIAGLAAFIFTSAWLISGAVLWLLP